ncbi:HutD/Ves family protein [Pantoea rwandensis]|uniref:HutD family protein n=1 Tax=Pantoea rwandensis TaxID=1076550 RepID=A0A1X1CTR7_9GAMM|nr:HutD family protein [Pantoea rwandensis]ORM67740.1 HutD family protein [Pantoea rwandensis]
MKTRFDYGDLPVSRWRNGGGETREIVSFPPGEAQFGWRASIATIDASGPFSPFPDIDRVITLLHGDSVLLSSEQGQQHLLPHQPWAFPGEWAINAQISGSCQDFNIMTRRDSWQAQVKVVQQTAVSPHGVAWVLAGEWQTVNGETLAVNQGMWWLDENTQLAPVSAEASLLFVTLSRVL